MNCKNCEYGLKQSCGDFEKIICTYEEGECVKIAELKKENAELKKENAELKKKCYKKAVKDYCELEKEIAELKEQNTNLQEMLKTERSVTCKEEYLKKVTELEQENAELKIENALVKSLLYCTKRTCDNCGFVYCENFQRQRKSEPCSLYISYQVRIKNLAHENDILTESYNNSEMNLASVSEQLIKAKELLLELYDCIPSSMADGCKETLQKVALFFKDSEVEK